MGKHKRGGIMRNDSLSVIIPTRNRVHKLKRCLELLLAQIRGSDEVIVVDNGSTDGTADFLRHHATRHPQLKILKETRLGSSYARNLGFSYARNTILGFLDDDSFVMPGWVTSVRKYCTRDSHASESVYRGYIWHAFDRHTMLSDIFYAKLCVIWQDIAKRPEWKKQRILYHINACNCFFRREIAQKIHYLFDEERFPFIGEERDLAERLSLAGVTIRYAKTAGIIHAKSAMTLSSSLQSVFGYGRAEGMVEDMYKAPNWKRKLFAREIQKQSLHFDYSSWRYYRRVLGCFTGSPVPVYVFVMWYSVFSYVVFWLAYFLTKKPQLLTGASPRFVIKR